MLVRSELYECVAGQMRIVSEGLIALYQLFVSTSRGACAVKRCNVDLAYSLMRVDDLCKQTNEA